MSDYSGGKIEKTGQTLDGKHTLKFDFGGCVIPGVPDKKLAGRMPSGYGYVRPLESEAVSEEEQKLHEHWAKCRLPRLDYYVGLENGHPDPAAIPLLYPERLFVTGEDEDGKDITRPAILQRLKEIGISKAHPDFWHPVQIFHAINRGFPEFSAGLKADTDIGPTWYEVLQKLGGDLPREYSWEYSGVNYGILYFEPKGVIT